MKFKQNMFITLLTIFIIIILVSFYDFMVPNPINPNDISVEAYIDDNEFVIVGIHGASFPIYSNYEYRVESDNIYFKFYYGMLTDSNSGIWFYIEENGDFTNIRHMYIEDEYGNQVEIDFSKSMRPEKFTVNGL